MKRIILAVAMVLTAMTSNNTIAATKANTDSQDHVLVTLWQTYDKAAKADRPQDQLTALKTIMGEARSRKLAWDFYDAAQRTAEVKAMINWKDRAKAQETFAKDVEDFGEPAAVFYLRARNGDAAGLLKYARDNRDRLQQTCNVAFHKNDGVVGSRLYSKALLTTFANDWDYALWHCFLADPASSGILLDGSRGGVSLAYPWNAFVEYDATDNYEWGGEKEEKARKDFEDYRARYVNRAAELLGWQELLRIKMRSSRSEADFKALLDECKTFEKRRAAFPKPSAAGTSAATEYEIAHACGYAEALIGTLNDKMIGMEMKDGRLLVEFRNLASANLKVTRDRKTVWQTVVTNPKRSFFVTDSVWVDVPVMDDGDYDMTCTNGKVEGKCSYSRHTLSIATRRDSRGYGVYVADYKTGEPLKKCDFTLMDNAGTPLATVKNVSLDGFTPLPKAITDKMVKDSWRYRLVASEGASPQRLSKNCYLGYYGQSVTDDEDGLNCRVLTDRAAFNPGETVHFKVVAWNGKYDLKAVPAGTRLTAIIEQEGNELARKSLLTNEFGSAEGEFELVRTERGGLREISIEKDGRRIGYKAVRVDDFVLPTFTLEWEKDSRIYVPGDTLAFRGKISAYSGHNLAAATARYEIRRYSEVVATGVLDLDPQGRFEVRFPVPSGHGGSYDVNVVVSDATGETLEFGCNRYVSDYLPLDISLAGGTQGTLSIPDKDRWRKGIVSGDEAVFDIRVREADATAPGLEVRWTLSRGGIVLQSGCLGGSGKVSVPVRGLPSGLYKFDVKAVLKGRDGEEYKAEGDVVILKMADSDAVLCDDVTAVIRNVEDDPLALQIGATGGRTWFVMELFGNGNVLLDKKLVELKGERGAKGSLEIVRFARKAGWPESLTLKVFVFKEGEAVSWSREIEPADLADRSRLPLSFTRFLDTTLPGTEYSFEIATAPGVECAAAVFDKSTETIRRNSWETVYHPLRPVPTVSYSSTCGSIDSSYGRLVKQMGARNVAMKAAGAPMSMSEEAVILDCAVADCLTVEEVAEGESIAFQLADKDLTGVAVRENFAKTVAWEPFLRSDADGRIRFEFRTADKLSTYIVQLYVHDKNINTGVLRQEMVVTLPVQVAVVEPQYLYDGDRYVVHATLSNSSEESVAGKVVAEFFDAETYRDADPVRAAAKMVTVAAGGAAECSFEAPALVGSKVLGVLLRFIPEGGAGADAVFVTVPLYRSVQTITEAHSGVLKAGESRSSLEAQLRALFVNVPGAEAVDTLISIRQMLCDAVPQSVEPKSDNILALLDAVYSNILARRLGAPGASDAQLADMEKKIAACRNSDGGYAWFEGMSSSPVVTAAALERLYRMASAGYVVPAAMQTDAAALFLDKAYFDEKVRPSWCGGISMEQYLYVRALYPVAFKAPSIGAKSWREHKKAIKDYLVPSGARGLNGMILAKARRLATLRALLASPAGEALAAGWGITLPARMSRSVAADVESLLQYSVSHWAGGCYYPNAVMPWRGLLESELYAHNVLARLMQAYGHSEVADGIRLWMMIQKETQQWESDPAYVEALGCVFEGSEALLQTSVLALSASCSKPFADILPAGNDFTVSRRWFVLRPAPGAPVASGSSASPAEAKVQVVELRDGDVLHVGDKVRAEYRIWNRENRSFVKLSAPRPATLRPVAQLSGHVGWWLRPLRVSGWYDVSPQGYRSVLTDRTEYWFDTYPEENTTVTEEFFVTQEGVFQTPVVTIESLYAPHYRANSSGESPLVID